MLIEMGKEKKKKSRITVMIPILSKKEMNPEFLDYACRDADEIVLMLVIDKDVMVGQFGFAATEIKEGTDLVETLSDWLSKKGKTAKEVVEWGPTDTKIIQVAQLNKVDKIVIVAQDNKFFKELVGKMEDALSIPVETFEVKPVKESEGGKTAGKAEDGAAENEYEGDAPQEVI